ncbi:predicted protein [Sclerotinia sclerotiorum 1980 UF-70]|uniref:Uncharacterized protein n=1 Tax=Sclerotinia sclerotiorum (strain ATCC 18683 / 1980 / Ss-1) TaxID=665079 RepID=A7F222_SCLS1|nr:predicted protein [Sclerotinia sclerotiorum 1980 UF-70]EDN95764.1 predicted protein [Sclerotinia sclerotiorum 1980 UF-70]
MPPKLLKRPVSAKQQTKLQPKTKQKGKGKVQTVVEAPKTAQDLVLNQKQSLELVKIGVNAAFMSGTNIPKNLNLMEAGDEILSFNTIVRGSGNQGAEKLLDWLVFHHVRIHDWTM